MTGGETKFVRFDKYCKICKYCDLSEDQEPCDYCIENATNAYSEKPVCYIPQNSKEDK